MLFDSLSNSYFLLHGLYYWQSTSFYRINIQELFKQRWRESLAASSEWAERDLFESEPYKQIVFLYIASLWDVDVGGEVGSFLFEFTVSSSSSAHLK